MNKRGMSAIIETVLLILVVLAGVGIIVGAVMPLITGSIEKAKLCRDAEITINKDYTAFDQASNILTLTLSKGPKEVAITGIQIKLRDATGASNITVNNTVPGINADLVYEINTENLGIDKPVSIGIAPIITVGKNIHVCGITETAL